MFVRQVHFEGLSGTQTLNLEHRLSSVFNDRHYHCIVLEIRSNDFCDLSITADIVAGSIYQLGITVKETCGISHLVLY